MQAAHLDQQFDPIQEGEIKFHSMEGQKIQGACEGEFDQFEETQLNPAEKMRNIIGRI